MADVTRQFRHRPAHGQPFSRRHYARRTGHRPRRICARRTGARSAIRPAAAIGKKGAVFFVRVRGRLSNPEFRVRGEEGKRLRQGRRVPIRQEALRHPADDPPRHRRKPIAGSGGLCTRSTSTNCRSWRWTMTNEQSAVSIGLIREVFCSEFTPQLFAGVETHEPALRLVAQLVRHTEDDRPPPSDRHRSAARDLLGRYAGGAPRNDRRGEAKRLRQSGYRLRRVRDDRVEVSSSSSQLAGASSPSTSAAHSKSWAWCATPRAPAGLIFCGGATLTVASMNLSRATSSC